MFKLFLTAACALLVSVSPAFAQQGGRPVQVAHAGESTAQIQAKLDSFASGYLQTCSAQLRPTRSEPQLTNRNGKIVSTYIEIDPTSAKTELMPSQGKAFSHMAKLSYLEHTYEAVGDTPEAAANGVYMRIKSRRLTELPRYAQGVWKN